MKRPRLKTTTVGLLLAAATLMPWQLEADPVPECGATEMAALTSEQKSDFVQSYGMTVSNSRASARERTEKLLADLEAKGLCESSFLGIHYTHIVCKAQLSTLDNYQRTVDAQKDDCGKLLDHLSTPANWEKLASCTDDEGSAQPFRDQALDCTGNGICGEVHDWVKRSTRTAASKTQAVSMMPECLGTLYRDMYGTTVGDQIDIMDAFTVYTY